MRMLLDHETVAQHLKSYNIILQHRHRYIFTVDVRFYNERRGVLPQQLIFFKKLKNKTLQMNALCIHVFIAFLIPLISTTITEMKSDEVMNDRLDRKF